MANKPYGSGQKIFDQLQIKVGRIHDGLYKQISKNKKIDTLLEDALLAGKLKAIIEDTQNKTPFKQKLVQLEQQLKKTDEWAEAYGDQKHQLLLDEVKKHATKVVDSDEFEFNQNLTEQTDQAKSEVEEKKESFHKFIMMLTISSITNPQIQNTYLMSSLPKELKSKIDLFRMYIVGALLNPHRGLVDRSYFPSITNRHANNFTRTLLLEKATECSSSLDEWNTFFPYNTVQEDHIDNLKGHIDNMHKVSEVISKAELKKDIYYSRAKMLKRIGIVGLLLGAGIFLTAVGATLAFGILTGGIALLAVGAIATIAFIVYKNKSCSAKEELAKARDDYMNEIMALEMLDPETEEGAKSYNELSECFQKISDSHMSPHLLNKEMADRLISDHGPSITATVLNNIINQVSPVDENDMNEMMGYDNN